MGNQIVLANSYHPETRWGQGLTAAYFPKENVITFSKVGVTVYQWAG
jgi:hypothetical protein